MNETQTWVSVQQKQTKKIKKNNLPKCYNPKCQKNVSISKNGVKLSACSLHLSEYYTKCTLCITNPRAVDLKTQRLLLFCTKCYTDKYLANHSKSESKICDKCKKNVCSPEHKLCLTCRREWRIMCITCRKNKRIIGNPYHCTSCADKYKNNGCQARVWINKSIGRKRCWSIANTGQKYCKRCSDYGICTDENCHNLAVQDLCLECQAENKEITNDVSFDTVVSVDKSLCINCKELDRIKGELHCGRWLCM
jgi:hypothetical protein